MMWDYVTINIEHGDNDRLGDAAREWIVQLIDAETLEGCTEEQALALINADALAFVQRHWDGGLDNFLDTHKEGAA